VPLRKTTSISYESYRVLIYTSESHEFFAVGVLAVGNYTIGVHAIGVLAIGTLPLASAPLALLPLAFLPLPTVRNPKCRYITLSLPKTRILLKEGNNIQTSILS
jgi:hypothetical protein